MQLAGARGYNDECRLYPGACPAPSLAFGRRVSRTSLGVVPWGGRYRRCARSRPKIGATSSQSAPGSTSAARALNIAAGVGSGAEPEADPLSDHGGPSGASTSVGGASRPVESLKSILRSGAWKERLPNSPASGGIDAGRSFNFEEMHRFAAPAGRWEAMVRTFSDTGLRLGEVLPLRREDFDGETLAVRRTAHEGRVQEGTKTDHGESAPGRVVPCPPGLAALIVVFVEESQASAARRLRAGG